MTAEYNREKIKSQMQEHWDMDAATFDTHMLCRTFDQGNGWTELVYGDAEATPKFYIEVDAANEVWHFDWI